MTVNAVFVDIREVIAPGLDPDPASEALRALDAALRGDDPGQNCRTAHSAASEGLYYLAQVREKLEVWSLRDELLTSFREQLDAIQSGVDRFDADDWYRAQVEGRGDGLDLAQAKYVALDIATKEDAEELLALLSDTEGRLRQILSYVRHASQLLATGEGTESLRLFTPDHPEGADGGDNIASLTTQETWTHFVESLDTAAKYFGAAWESGDSGMGSVVFADGSEFPIGKEVPELVFLHAFFAAFSRRSQEALRRIRDDVQENFRPNIAERPLPDPYVLNLLPMDGVSGERARKFDIQVHRAPHADVKEVVRVALMDSGMGNDAYDLRDPERIHYREAEATKAIEISMQALDSAKAGGASLLIMPELFVPQRGWRGIRERAQELGIGVIAGLDYPVSKPDGAINEVGVFMPGLGGEVRQLKQRPSVYEPREQLFAGDGVLNVFLNTPAGNIGVVICSDYLELDIIWQLATLRMQLDVLVVCSRNPYSDVFERLAVADAVRLHAYVAVVNADFSDDHPAGVGTVIAQPIAVELLKPAAMRHALPGINSEVVVSPGVLLFDLDIGELRNSRVNERGRAGRFLRAPNFARRTLATSDDTPLDSEYVDRPPRSSTS